MASGWRAEVLAVARGRQLPVWGGPWSERAVALGSGNWRHEPSLYFAMSFLIDSSIMITSQVSHRVLPQDSSASLSRVVSSGPQRCGLARGLGLLARGQCPPHPCPELGESVGFAAPGSLSPSCQEASCGGPRLPPHPQVFRSLLREVRWP